MKAVREYHLKITLIFKQQKMQYQKTASKCEDCHKHRENVVEAIEFFELKLKEAYAKDIDIFVLQEVYRLTKLIRLLQESEDEIDTARYIKRKK